MPQIICITGASSGIGLATALKFAKNDWTVYAGTRHVQRDREQYADQANLHFLEMEVTDPESLRQAFNVIEQSHSQTVLGHVHSTGGILDDEYKPIFDAFLATFAKRNSIPQTSESVADIILDLVQMENKPLRLRTSDSGEAFTAHKVTTDPTGLDGVLNTRKLHLGL
jgi:NAD(P)-dependent dehydrogenase (short-subunit alcohol dehydrogenase family)